LVKTTNTMLRFLLTPYCLILTATHAQPFQLPPLDSLTAAVDAFYQATTQAQLEELKQSGKYRWVNYLPNPGFNPFTGGFNIQFNLGAPLAEFKMREASRQRAASIRRLNELEAGKIKNTVQAQYEAVRNAIKEFEAQDSLVYFKEIAFDLYSKQYQRNEMTPSEYLAKQQERQAFQLARLKEANAISEAIRQLKLSAYYPLR
jgi:hypothetical protein